MIEQKILAEAAAKSIKSQRPIFTNNVVEETQTAKLMSFTHGGQIRWTVYQKPVGQSQWSMVCQGYNEKLAKIVFEKIKAGVEAGRN